MFFFKKINRRSKLSIVQNIMLIFVGRNYLNTKLKHQLLNVDKFNQNYFFRWRLWNISIHAVKRQKSLKSLKSFNNLFNFFKQSDNFKRKLLSGFFIKMCFFHKNFNSKISWIAFKKFHNNNFIKLNFIFILLYKLNSFKLNSFKLNSLVCWYNYLNSNNFFFYNYGVFEQTKWFKNFSKNKVDLFIKIYKNLIGFNLTKFQKINLKGGFLSVCKKYFPIRFNETSLNKFINLSLINNLSFFYIRKNKIFNKGRYSRNRQIYRTGVYWCLWFNIISVYGLYFLFYRFTFNFGYLWVFLIIFFGSFIFSRALKYNFIDNGYIVNDLIYFKKWILFIWMDFIKYLHTFFKKFIFIDLFLFNLYNFIALKKFFCLSIKKKN